MSRRGLTLAEVLMAAGLLTTVLVLLVGVFVGGLKLMERSEVYTTASNIGREILETIEDEGGFAALPEGALSFNGANPDPPVDGFPPSPYPQVNRGGRDYVVRVETRPSPRGPGVNRLTTVLVTVSWSSGRIQLEKAFHAADTPLP